MHHRKLSANSLQRERDRRGGRKSERGRELAGKEETYQQQCNNPVLLLLNNWGDDNYGVWKVWGEEGIKKEWMEEGEMEEGEMEEGEMEEGEMEKGEMEG